MHELSIASSIINTVLNESTQQGYHKVLSISLRIGALSDIVPDLLKFGFDSLKKDSPLADTTLEIEHIPVQGRCNSCGKQFEVKEFTFICPNCESVDITVEKGEEIEIVSMEIDP